MIASSISNSKVQRKSTFENNSGVRGLQRQMALKKSEELTWSDSMIASWKYSKISITLWILRLIALI